MLGVHRPVIGGRGTLRARGLDLSWAQLCWTERGPIVEFVVAGGTSLRNPDFRQAEVLYEFVKVSLQGLAPAGLLFDLRSFKYGHGDSIGAAFMQASPDRSGLIPVTVVAKGRTKRGLSTLLRLGGADLLVHLVTDERAQALEFLLTRVNSTQ